MTTSTAAAPAEEDLGPTVPSTKVTKSPRSHSPGRLQRLQGNPIYRSNFEPRSAAVVTASPRNLDDENPSDEETRPPRENQTSVSIAPVAQKNEKETQSTVSQPFDEQTSFQGRRTSSSNKPERALGQFKMPPPRLADPIVHPFVRDDDNDSLFDFDKEAVLRQLKMEREQRTRARLDEEDDTSVDNPYGSMASPTNLQERSQAAWNKRRSGAKSPSNGVSFGTTDTVHHFEHEYVENNDDETYGERSLNSTYTKSMESEVEDAIKDLFLIGKSKNHTPGRKKIRDNPRVKRRLRQDDNDELTDEESLENEARRRSQKSQERAEAKVTVLETREKGTSEEKKDAEVDGNDPLLDAWNFVESGFTAVGAALGLESSEDPRQLSTSRVSRDIEEERDLYDERDRSKPSRARSSEVPVRPQRKSLLDYAAGVFTGPSSPSGLCDRPETNEAEADVPVEYEFPTPRIEDDSRLIDLAAQAAISAHKLEGYTINPSYEVDISQDIKFVVVDLTLPLGIIFQEHAKGVWVTKILETGSAATGKKVRVGDQLAGIEGHSTIELKVEEIAEIVRKQAGSIEMTFLRYVGPYKPAAGRMKEEGYEVQASSKPRGRLPPMRKVLDRPSSPEVSELSLGQSEEGSAVSRFTAEVKEAKVPISAANMPTGFTQPSQPLVVEQKAPKKRFGLFRRKQ